MSEKDLLNIAAAEFIIKKLNERDDHKKVVTIVEHLMTAVISVMLTVMVIGFNYYSFKAAVAKWWSNFL